MMKKLTSILLALVMALTLCTAAWADSSVIPSYDWFDNHTGTYTISSDADLLGFMHIANGTRSDVDTPYTFAGATVRLANDINLDGATWTPVGAETAQFMGTFDGQGHSIKNFVLGTTSDSDGYQYCGFFNWIAWGGSYSDNTGMVCNLTLENVTATIGENGRFGTVACYVGGGNDSGGTDEHYVDHQIYNVHVKDVTVTSTSASARVGGMFCRTSRSFKNCTVENLTVNAPNGITTLGGFVSFSYANNQRFQNCSVNGITVNAANCNNEDGIGGFAGYFNNSYGWTNFFETCAVSNIDMTISGSKAWVGGFVGSPCANIIATNCTTQGSINAGGVTGGFVGGFMGNYGWKAANGAVYSVVHQLTNCTANVNIISGGAPAGGFIGSASTSNNGSKYGIFTNCTANGDVTNTNGAAGGFAGEAVSGQYNNCTTTGTVTGQTAGGFIGEAKDYTPSYDNVFSDRIGQANEIKIDGSKAEGVVIGSENSGGLVGKVGEKTSPTSEPNANNGTNGQLIVANSSSTGTVVGTTSTTNVNEGINGSGSKLNSAASTGNTPTSTTVKGNNITVATDPNTNITVITAPVGTVVNGEAITEAERIDGTNGKVIPTMTLSAESGSMKAGKTVTFTYTFTGDGAITATSSNPAVATVTVDKGSKTVTVTGVSAGSVTITVKVEETDAYDAASADYTVEVTRNQHRVKSNATPTETVESPKTFDAGIAVYGVMAVSSVLGMGYMGKKSSE